MSKIRYPKVYLYALGADAALLEACYIPHEELSTRNVLAAVQGLLQRHRGAVSVWQIDNSGLLYQAHRELMKNDTLQNRGIFFNILKTHGLQVANVNVWEIGKTHKDI